MNDDEAREWDIVASDEGNASEFMIVNISSKAEIGDINLNSNTKLQLY